MKLFNIRIYFFLAVLLSFCSACKYSFTGISIPPNVQTFYVAPFDIQAPNAEPNLSQTFSDALRDKIQTESRLNQSEVNPHIEFKGNITRYDVSSVAPQPGELTAFNRLNVTVNVEYINIKDEEAGWTQNFSYFSDFESTDNFLDVQDRLIETINEQLVEDIFNKAFTNW